MLKSNGPAVALPAIKVNAAPLVVGLSDDGFAIHVAGIVPVQLKFTVPVYPWIAVSVPFHVTFCPATVELGVAVTASEKSGCGPVTFNVNVCGFGAGAPVTFAASMTVALPMGVLDFAVTVKPTVMGVSDVGVTALDGEKTHAAPDGNPLEQLKFTVPEKDPSPAT